MEGGTAENSCRRLDHVRCARKSAHRPTPLRGSDRALLVWMTCAVSAGRQAKPVEQTIYSPTEFRSPRCAVPSLSFRRDGGVPGVRNCEDSRIPPTAFCCFGGSERTEIAVPSSSASGSSHSYLIAADVPGEPFPIAVVFHAAPGRGDCSYWGTTVNAGTLIGITGTSATDRAEVGTPAPSGPPPS